MKKPKLTFKEKKKLKEEKKRKDEKHSTSVLQDISKKIW